MFTISTHAPRTGSDRFGCTFHSYFKAFQPTLPARGATWLSRQGNRREDISTHAPRTGSDKFPRGPWCGAEIFQPTLPARGATSGTVYSDCKGVYFNPRSPHGERRCRCKNVLRRNFISTHAPRTGSDVAIRASMANLDLFQPTLPARGATFSEEEAAAYIIFQPTLPARGATRTGCAGVCDAGHFNPRSPHGERLASS